MMINDLMDFPPVAIVSLSISKAFSVPSLFSQGFAEIRFYEQSVAFMNDWIKLVVHTRPALENTTRIRSKADDIAQYFEFRKAFEEQDRMSLSVAFNGGRQTSKACANNYYTNSRRWWLLRSHVEVDNL